jgi:hypothetical protein
MDTKTITLQICAVTDHDTGIITAFFADDYSTVTQGVDMDQVTKRLVAARNLIGAARKKYGYSTPVIERNSNVSAGFRNEELTLALA